MWFRGKTRVLAVVAHPDDETLSCGGALARHAIAGDTVRVTVLTDGVGSREDRPRARDGPGERAARVQAARSVRAAEYAAALRAIGATSVETATFPDQAMSQASMLSLTETIANVVRAVRPDVVYTHWHSDLNADHRCVAEAVMVVTRRHETVRWVLGGEVPETTSLSPQCPFVPSVWIDLGRQAVLRKCEAVACYASERRVDPHPRSPEAVSARLRYWGGVSGVAAAEAFALYRGVM